MGVLFLFVFQVQTLYYSPDHKLVDGGLMEMEVFGGEEDHLQFVQVLHTLCLASLVKPLLGFAQQCVGLLYSLCIKILQACAWLGDMVH